MESLVDILNKKKNYRKLLKIVSLQSILKKKWSYIFGKCADDLQFNSINGSTLNVDSCNYVWVSEIAHFKNMIISRINTLAAQGNIKHIKVLYLPRSKFYKDTKGKGPGTCNMDLESKIKASIDDKIKRG